MKRRSGGLVTVEGSQEIDGEDIEYTANVTVIYRPAQISGPVESCYPDESETEIVSLVTVPPGFEDKLDEEAIEEKAWEFFLSGDY